MIKQIRPDLPVIAQTAFASAGDEENCYKSGCDDYISKPILRDILLEKIAKYIG
jgi:CheY-like chemotaxis protein